MKPIYLLTLLSSLSMSTIAIATDMGEDIDQQIANAQKRVADLMAQKERDAKIAQLAALEKQIQELEESYLQQPPAPAELQTFEEEKTRILSNGQIEHDKLGQYYTKTGKTNNSGHKEVIGANGCTAYYDPSTVRTHDNGPEIIKGLYIMEGANKFYTQGNCVLFPNEGPGSLNKKWQGGSLHNEYKYKDLSNTPQVQQNTANIKSRLRNIL